MNSKNLTLLQLSHVLFCTTLQPSEQPDAPMVRRAIARFLLRNEHAFSAAAAEVAARYGDDPEASMHRLRWSRAQAALAFPAAARPHRSLHR